MLSQPCHTFRLKSLTSRKPHFNELACGSVRRFPVIEECFDSLAHEAVRIADPSDQAFFLVVHVPCLQPLEDANRRVSRLTANIPLIKSDLSPLSFIDVPETAYIFRNVGRYELTRVELLREKEMRTRAEAVVAARDVEELVDLATREFARLQALACSSCCFKSESAVRRGFSNLAIQRS